MITSQLTNFVANNFFSIVVSTILIYVIRFYTNYFNRPSKIPGPLPLPIIGNLHQIGADFPAAAKKFRERYGDLYEFYMGSRRIVTISRPDLAEQVWGPSSVKNTKFIYRNSYSEGVDELGLGTKGVLFNRNIEDWTINRKFMIQSISSPSFLREAVNVSSKIIDEVFGYWETIGKNGSGIYIPDWFDALAAEIVSTTAVGKRITATTELFDKLNVNEKKTKLQGIWENGITFVKSIHLYNESMAFMMLLPTSFRRSFPGIKNLNKKYLDNKRWIEDELERLIVERRTEIENTPSDKPLEPTILTLLLTTNTEKDLEKLNVGKFDRPLTDEELGSIIREVFTGGLDTTSNSLSFIVFYIAKYPEVYSKMRQEVLNVYGTLDNPDLAYESYGKLKYIEAVINEGIRIFPTISIIPRATIEEVEFDGFKIEADTTVYTDLGALSNDPRHFKDPEKFNPDRFLDDKEQIKRFTYIPFGSGVRICPGRAWGIVQIKTFLVKLVCKFDIELVDKNATPKYVYATANRPIDINIRVKPRKI